MSILLTVGIVFSLFYILIGCKMYCELDLFYGAFNQHHPVISTIGAVFWPIVIAVLLILRLCRR